MFEEIKNRDAWSVVRGFVYQVDLTILRWLELNENEVLELEKGEDIDLISHDLDKKETLRELEQIKYREFNITLNQEFVLEMLLNYFLHKTNNPSKKLLFRFVTNTDFGIERPALFSDGKGGIEVWIELFNDNTLSTSNKKLTTIKEQLLKKVEEKIVDDSKLKEDKDKLTNNNWSSFKTFLKNDNQLIEFIKDFEWSLKNDDNIQIGESIKGKLLDDHVEGDKAKSEMLYSRLFLHVFKLLCNRSLKQLDKEGLDNQISLPGLNRTDQNLLKVLSNLINSLDNRVSDLENKTISNTTDIATLIGDVELITNSDTVFKYRLKNLPTKSPSTVKNGSSRKKKVAEILKKFDKISWFGFQGINGTGKSQLASLISHEFENYYWLDLKAYINDTEKVISLLEAFLSIISNKKIIHDRNVWIENVISSLPDQTLIVLNDIPRLEYGSSISELLILFTSAISDSNIRLLTTSNHKVLNSVKQSLASDLFEEYYDFEFTDEEMIEYFVKSGAKSEISKYISIIAAISHRNPRLISAIIHHLKTINWGENSDELFDVFFKKEFSAETLNDAQNSIKTFISDEKSKELLYRLSLIHWNFKLQEVKVISDVNEKVVHPNEKFHDLIDIWIQEQSDNSYYVSPLIYDIGEKNLTQDVIQNVHLAIARSIMSSKRIDQISASRGISSFLKGNDYNNAGIILMNVYQSVKNKEEIQQLKSWGFLNYWSELDIPKEMSLILRAFIRNEQIRINSLIDKDTTILHNRLEAYLDEKPITSSESLILHSFCLSNFRNGDLSKFWIHFIEIFRHWHNIEESFKEVINIEMVAGLLWIPVKDLQSDDDIKNWLTAIDLLKAEVGINFFDDEISQFAITILSRQIVYLESENEENRRSWDNASKKLEYLRAYFEKRNLEILEAVVLVELIVIEYQFNKHALSAIQITNENVGKFATPEAKYLLYENLGKLYFKNGHIEESNLWFIKALKYECTDQYNYIETLIYSASSISKFDSSKAVEYCELAVELAKQREDYLELDYIQAIGERAIAYWINGDFIKSLESFEDVVNRLFKIKGDSFNEYWIRLFKRSGHALGYISASVGREKVPEFVSDGGEYVKPYQGILTLNTTNLSDLYKPENDSLIMVHLAIFSDGVNSIRKSYDWSLKAFDHARKTGDQRNFLMISTVCAQYALINFKIEEAFESYLLSSAVSRHLEGSSKERYIMLSEVSIADIVNSRPSENWNAAEDTAVGFVVIPLFIMVLTAQLEKLDDKEKKTQDFQYTIKNYIDKASNKILWELVSELSSKILNKSISERELIDRGNAFGNNEQKNLQIICILGIIYSYKENILQQIINIFPYLTKTQGYTRSIIKFVLIPFVKNRCLHVLKEEFVGNRQELNSMVSDIEKIDLLNKNAMQLMLQPVIKELELEIIDSRKPWLYDFKEI